MTARHVWKVLFVGVALTGAPSPAWSAPGAGSPSPAARVTVVATCEPRAAKGRVVCDVELESDGGRIAWADVVVVEAPAFAPPLRSRIAMTEARTRTERRLRIPVAFVASGAGKGAVRFRGRAVVCVARADGGGEVCETATNLAGAELVVGVHVEH